MGDGQQSRSLALALLAVLVGAIVQIISNSGPFTLWQSMVGLIMVCTAFAYFRDVGFAFFERLAHSLILAGGSVFMFGYWIDRAVTQAGVVTWKCDELPCKITKYHPGRFTDSLQDEIFCGL